MEATLICPPFAEVANAVGAAVGGVSATVEITVLQPEPGTFSIHGQGPPQRFTNLESARDAAERLGRKVATQRASAAGATGIAVEIEEVRQAAEIGGAELLVEMRLRATARGQPDIRPKPPVRPRDSR